MKKTWNCNDGTFCVPDFTASSRNYIVLKLPHCIGPCDASLLARGFQDEIATMLGAILDSTTAPERVQKVKNTHEMLLLVVNVVTTAFACPGAIVTNQCHDRFYSGFQPAPFSTLYRPYQFFGDKLTTCIISSSYSSYCDTRQARSLETTTRSRTSQGEGRHLPAVSSLPTSKPPSRE